MLSCRTLLPGRLCPQPVHTLWPLPLSVSEPLGCTAWEQAEQVRKSLDFMQRIFEELPKEFRGERARIPRQGAAADGGQSGTVGEGGDGFSLSLQLPRFSPEELKVKVVGRKVLVTGKHEKRSGDGSGSYSYTGEEFRREFQLPGDVDAQAVNCCLSQDGRLKVEAPRLALPPVGERTVPVNVASGTTSSPRLHPGEEARERESGGVGGTEDEMEAKAEI